MFTSLWRRFNVWLAMQIYGFVIYAAKRLELLKRTADRMVERHSADPQGRLELGD